MILGGGDDVDDVMPEVVVENEVPMQSWTPPGGWDRLAEGVQGLDGDGGDGTLLAERDDEETQPNGDDAMNSAEAFRMDRFDADSEVGSRTGASDRDGEADNENRSGAANAQVHGAR